MGMECGKDHGEGRDSIIYVYSANWPCCDVSMQWFSKEKLLYFLFYVLIYLFIEQIFTNNPLIIHKYPLIIKELGPTMSFLGTRITEKSLPLLFRDLIFEVDKHLQPYLWTRIPNTNVNKTQDTRPGWKQREHRWISGTRWESLTG